MRKPLVSELTLREKIGQTALGRPMNTEYLDLERYPYGFIWALGNIEMGVINMDDKAGAEVTNRKKWNQFLKELSPKLKVPIMSAMDSTNGIMNSFGEFPYIMDPVTMGAADSEEIAFEAGALRAEHLKYVGVNWLWSPEVDLPSRLSSICLGRRYSDDPDKLLRLAIADMKGIQSKRLAATAKHFPGTDGLEYRDAHTAENMMILPFDEWMERQGWLFQRMIDEGVDSIMIAHTTFPAYDNSKVNGRYRPASVSYKIITELLKEKMGFQGVAITDGITMKSLMTMFDGDMDRVYVEAIKAGNDVVLAVRDGYFDAIEKAVLSGEISEERINDACQRVLDLKEKLGVFEDDYQIANEDDAALEECICRTVAFNEKVAKKAVSLVCDKRGLFPLDRDAIRRVAIIYNGRDNDVYDSLSAMAEAFEKRGASVHIQRGFSAALDITWEEIRKLDAEYDLLVYVGYIMRAGGGLPTFSGDDMRTFHNALVAGAEKTVGVSLGSPFVYYDFYSSFPVFINAYNPSSYTQEAVVAAMYGEIAFSGTEPYELYPPMIKHYMKVNNIEL